MSRLTTAMGATGGAVWRLDNEPEAAAAVFQLLSSHRLPAELADGEAPSTAHRKILECVVSEGHPILVPPASVKVETSRPANPLADALIIIPIRIQDAIELVVEVVQRPSGGPTAQRGYLRFVAQMSDLLSDFERQHQLRVLTHRQQFIQQVEECLSGVACAESKSERHRLAIDSLRQIFDCEHAILVNGSKKAVVEAIAGTGSFDPRSELLLNVARFTSEHQTIASQAADTNSLQVFDAVDRRQEEATSTDGDSHSDPAVERVCDQLGCRRLLLLPLGRHHDLVALLTFADADVNLESQLPAGEESLVRFARSVGCLLESQTRQPKLGIVRPSSSHATSARTAKRSQYRVWAQRAAVVGLLVLIAILPVPQRIRADATLHPSAKQNYYAPRPAIVTEVYVREGDELVPDQEILRLYSQTLEDEILSLGKDAETLESSIENRTLALGKRDQLSPLEVADLSQGLDSSIIKLDAIQAELKLRNEERESLTIRAKTRGQVSTWGIRNGLLDRPVHPGDLLVSTFEPEGDWYFEVAVPEHRLGIVSNAIAESGSHVAVKLSLSSEPDHIVVGKLLRLDSKSTSAAVSIQQEESERAVMARVAVDGSTLPLRKDGAFAHASIDCGRVPLIWLVFRDAYCQVSSRIRMLW